MSITQTTTSAIVLILCSCLPATAQDRRRDPAQIFGRLDKNRDGYVDETELQRPSVFDQYDADGDGRISRAELTLATPAAASDIRVTKDVAYGTHAQQKLDHYRPATLRSGPVMIYIHGGGWRIGDKKAVGQKAEFFCGKGWAFVSVNYRLLPTGEHPHNVNDVAAAIAWMAEHADELGIDRQQLFVMGHSAGAHLAALVATHPEALSSVGLSRSQIKGVISLDTNAYDVANLMTSSSARYYGQVFGRDPQVWQDASPQRHVSKDAELPPFLICYSSGMRVRKDPQRARNARAFEAALREHDIAATVIDASDRNHSEINQRFGSPDDRRVTSAAWQFLRDLLPETVADPADRR